MVDQKQALCEIISLTCIYDQESNESDCTIRNKDKECGASSGDVRKGGLRGLKPPNFKTEGAEPPTLC